MSNMIKKFAGNFKNYFDYIMTVNFGDLFINVLILLCIVLLSTFVFVPIGLIESLIRDFLLLFIDLPGMLLSIYSWVFTLISTLFAFLAFIYLFNKRFEDIEAFKNQLNNKAPVKQVKKEEEVIELPKAKASK